MEINEMVNQSKTSILISFLPGMEAGNAIADVLVGDENPYGRLSDTWAKKIDDYPSTKTFKASNDYVKYKETLFVGYRYFELDEEIIDLIANNVETNVRELEHALQQILAYADIIEQKPTLEMAKNQLKDIINSNQTQNISLDIIQKVVADNYQISIADLKSKKRDKKFVIPRQIAIYIARELTEISYTELGNEFGGKDHSTIMTSYKKIADQIKTDPSLESKIQLYIREIKEYRR